MGESTALCNTVVLLVTVVVSVVAFSRRDLEERLIFDAEPILAGKQYYRLVTAALLHAGWWHLGLNVVGLLAFGPTVESVLGRGQYLLVYLGSIVGGNLLSLFLHRHHVYRAYRASGGVSGIVFACVLISPLATFRLWMMPLPMPAWIYAIVFMGASFWGIKRASENKIGRASCRERV